jgi:hypothetical protein
MMSAGGEPLFLDSNILVYANAAIAPQQQAALQVIQHYATSGTPLWISRQVIREFLAVTTHPQTFASLGMVTVLRIYSNALGGLWMILGAVASFGTFAFFGYFASESSVSLSGVDRR